MFGFARLKDMRKQFEILEGDISKLTDENIKNKEKFKKLNKLIISIDKVDLMIREAFDREKLLVQSGPNSGPITEPNHKPIKKKGFDKVVLLKAQKTRPEFLKQSIMGLLDKGMKTIDIFNIVVTEKNLCGKTQFYHYLSLVKSKLQTEVRSVLNIEK